MESPEPPFDPADMPTEVRLQAGGRRLSLTWPEGEASASASALRAACRCAWCTRARHDGQPPRPAADLAIAEIRPLGRFAAHIAFSDGHRKGVFPWTFLRGLTTASESIA